MKIKLSRNEFEPPIGSDAAPTEDRVKPRVARRAFAAMIGLCALLLLAVLAYERATEVPPQLPVPENLEKLDPQLRAYISTTIQWVRTAPRAWDRHATLGMVYAANSLWPEAGLAFSNVVRLDPSEPLARLYVGVSTQESGEFDEALKAFQQLTAQFPNFAQGHYRLGEALLRAGDIEGTEKAFQRLVELAPKEWRGYAGLGDVRLRKGDHADAVRWLEKAVQLDWSATRAHHLLGLALRAAGRMQEAELELGLGLNAVSFPMPDAWSENASDHMKLLQDQLAIADESSQAGQPQKAVKILQEALRFHPTNLMVLNNLAIAYNRSGQPQKARPLLLKLLQSDSHYLPGFITLSFTSQLLGANDDALTFAERALALAPNTAQAHVAKANALLAMERDAEAVAALEAGFRCDPKNAEIQVELGDVCWRNLNRPAEALEHYQKAVQLNRSFLKAHLRVAELALERKDSMEAARAIEMVRKIAPREPGLAVLENHLQKLSK